MSISSEFQENVQSGDLITVRSALADYLIIDRTFKSFDDALEYASRKLPIIQEYDSKPFEEDSSNWNKDYLNKQKVALMVNFSQKRIDHIKKVIKIVLPVSTQSTGTSIEKVSSVSKPNKHTQHSISTKRQQPKQISNESSKTGSSIESKTGRRVIYEQKTTSHRFKEQKSSEGFNYGTALIVGGIAVAALSVLPVKPIAIGTAVVMIGVGCTKKIKNK